MLHSYSSCSLAAESSHSDLPLFMLATIQRTIAAGVKHVRPMPFDGVGVRGVHDIALGCFVCVCVFLGMKLWWTGYWPLQFIFPNIFPKCSHLKKEESWSWDGKVTVTAMGSSCVARRLRELLMKPVIHQI